MRAWTFLSSTSLPRRARVFERLYHQALVLRQKLQHKKERLEMEAVR